MVHFIPSESNTEGGEGGTSLSDGDEPLEKKTYLSKCHDELIIYCEYIHPIL